VRAESDDPGVETTENLPHSMPDAQGALPTIILEMLLYSRPGVIEPLPVGTVELVFRRGLCPVEVEGAACRALVLRKGRRALARLRLQQGSEA
jgi:hypothetical protein